MHATTVVTEDGVTTVTYHSTPVVTWVQKEDLVILDVGAMLWFTPTTKNRMNQTATEFGLPYAVYQKSHDWFVRVRHDDGTYEDIPWQGRRMTIEW